MTTGPGRRLRDRWSSQKAAIGVLLVAGGVINVARHGFAPLEAVWTLVVVLLLAWGADALIEIRTLLRRVDGRTPDLREVRDTSRRIAGSVGRMAPIVRALKESGVTAPPAQKKEKPKPAKPVKEAAPRQSGAAAFGRAATPGIAAETGWRALPEKIGKRSDAGVAYLAGSERELVADLGSRGLELVPGHGFGTLKARRPSVLVIDRQALYRGPWSGAEASYGLGLFQQIADIARWCNSESIPVYVLQNDAAPNVNTAELFALADAVFPHLSAEGFTDLPHSPEFAVLQQYGVARSNGRNS